MKSRVLVNCHLLGFLAADLWSSFVSKAVICDGEYFFGAGDLFSD